MPTEFITADLLGDGVLIERGYNDANLVIGTGVLVGSASNNAIVLKASFHDVLLRGTVSGYGSGITFGAQAATQQANTLRIAGDGLLQAEVNGATFWGGGRMDNLGTVWAGTTGVQVNIAGTQGFRLVNDGTISGGREGVWIVGAAGTKVTVVNTGIIEGGEHSYRGFGNEEVLLNRGILHGDVRLHDGVDRYDGRGGLLEEGEVYGGAGDDTFLPGAGAETFYGETGSDWLDFRGSGGVSLDLMNDSGSGVAEDDLYLGIEGILGARGGRDVLLADGTSNLLRSFGGDDSLAGRGGADVLDGGFGRDQLSGGGGNDVFVITTPEHGGDVIFDWGSVAGNNDALRIDPGSFWLNGGQGRVYDNQFRVRADNLAQDSDDRFVFRTTDQTLWWDIDGTGGAGPVLIADLQPGAVLTASDILFA